MLSGPMSFRLEELPIAMGSGFSKAAMPVWAGMENSRTPEWIPVCTCGNWNTNFPTGR